MAIDCQFFLPEIVISSQVDPVFVDVNIFSPGTIAANLLPSFDDVTSVHCLLPGSARSVQVVPLFVEVNICQLYSSATSFVPSAEEATACQAFAPTKVLFSVQLPPEFVEVYT